MITGAGGADMASADPSVLAHKSVAAQQASATASLSADSANYADAAHDMMNNKQAKLAKVAHHHEEEERELLNQLPEAVKEDVIERSAMREAWEEVKEKAPGGALMFAAFSIVLLAAGSMFAWMPAALEGIGVMGGLAKGLTALAGATLTGAVWVGGNSAYKKYKETKAVLEGREDAQEEERETAAAQAKEKEQSGPDYRQPGTRETGELAIAGHTLTSIPGAVAYLQHGLEEGREMMQDMGSGARSAIDRILEQGPRSRHAAAMGPMSATERLLQSQEQTEVMRG
jgi:hypothetical protein